MKKSMIFTTFISVALLSGCGTVSTLAELDGVRPFKVKLEVDGNVLRNDRGPNTNCTGFADPLKKGCFVAEQGEVLELEFSLQQPPGRIRWRFTELMICAGTTKPTNLDPCALDLDQQVDWLVVAEDELALLPSDGTVDLTDFSPELRKFKVLDINGHVGDYTYNIQACKEGSTAPADCARMDPGGRNKGR